MSIPFRTNEHFTAIGSKSFSVRRLIENVRKHPDQTTTKEVPLTFLSEQVNAPVWLSKDDEIISPKQVLADPNLSWTDYLKIQKTGQEVNLYPILLITISEWLAEYLSIPKNFVDKVWVLDGNHRLAYYWQHYLNQRGEPFLVKVTFVSEHILTSATLENDGSTFAAFK